MFSGIVNPYSTISPEYVYPRNYYLIQELTGNSIYFYQNTLSNNIANVYSIRNPVNSSSVPLDHGVITFDEAGKTLILDTRSATLRNKTIEYFVNTPNLTTNTFSNTHFVLTNTTGTVLFRMQPSIENNSTNSIIVSHKNSSTASATTISNVIVSSSINWRTSGWNHLAFSSQSDGVFRIHLNGTRLYTSPSTPATSLVHDFGTPLQLRLSCNTTPVYYSDIRITNQQLYTQSNFTVPSCPLQPLNNTIILLSGNFDPTRFRKSVVSTVNLTNSHPTSLSGSAVFTGYLELSGTNQVGLSTGTTASSKIGIVIGNDGYSKQHIRETTTSTLTTTTFTAQANSFAPCYVYITNSGGTCSLNGTAINFPRISNVQFANTFMMCNASGDILKNTNPPTFTSIGGFDNLMLRPSNVALSVNISNVLAGNTYLVDQQNRFIGYSGTGFSTGTAFEWNFIPLGNNRFRTAAGDVFIFLK